MSYRIGTFLSLKLKLLWSMQLIKHNNCYWIKFKYDKLKVQWAPPLPSSTQIYRTFMLNPTIIVICLFI